LANLGDQILGYPTTYPGDGLEPFDLGLKRDEPSLNLGGHAVNSGFEILDVGQLFL
jgi:hypothetical protein